MIRTRTQANILRNRILPKVEQLMAERPDLAPELETRLDSLSNREGTITFAGRFKTGKSTLLNAALGRPLLPYYDLPETGAICRLRSGAIDSAHAKMKSSVIKIECTTDAIRKVIALQREDGEDNDAVHECEAVEIIVGGSATCPIPSSICWVDSPGFGDREEMDNRALSALAQTDIAVFIMNTTTDQISNSSASRIEEYSANYGSAGIFLVVNVFLRKDSIEEWLSYQSGNQQHHVQRMRDFIPSFEDLARPIFASARALGGDCRRVSNPIHALGSFGGNALWSVLGAIDSGLHPNIQIARLQRLEKYLQRIPAAIDSNEMRRKRSTLRLKALP